MDKKAACQGALATPRAEGINTSGTPSMSGRSLVENLKLWPMALLLLSPHFVLAG